MKRRYIVIAVCAAVFLVLTVAAVLVLEGWLPLNNPARDVYPVRGVDVSSYQGDIDWPLLARQDVAFAFIKATEGSSYVDPRFRDNWENATATGLRIGAYHFFSYDSAGDTQADNFIAQVPAIPGMLPPVVDIEFYGDKEQHPPPQEEVRRELDRLLARLEAHYGMRPILYATENSYTLYIAGGYDTYDIWIRNVLTQPTLSDGRAWTFWQYSNRGRLSGYSGRERFIDLNVFSGSASAFADYPQ